MIMASEVRTDPKPAHHRWLEAFRFIGRHERGALITFFLLLAGLLAFRELAEIAVAPEAHAFDRNLLLAMRSGGDTTDPVGPEWFEGMVRDVTSFGGVIVQAMVAVSVIGFLLLERKKGAALFVTAAVSSGAFLSFVLKDLVGRARPDIISRELEISSLSFPSGHSMMSAVTYLTLGALLARTQRSRLVKAYVLVLGILLTLSVGLSRMYLGVHWPTDVLAGWTAGAAWALLCWSIALRLQKKKVVDPRRLPEELPSKVSWKFWRSQSNMIYQLHFSPVPFQVEGKKTVTKTWL
jgi:undecaprenyl-diphosphatase